MLAAALIASLLGPATSRADEAMGEENAFEPNYPVALDERVTDPSIDLEHAFWRCDHAVSHGLIDSGTAAVCSEVTEKLKAKRFQGDFDQMLSWWRENRDAEYAALDVAADELSVP